MREDKHPTPAPAEEEPERYEPELPQRREETYISEEDDLDPEMFVEEQPEDSFLQRGGRVEPALKPNRKLSPKRTHRQGANMERHLRKGGRFSPMDIKLRLDDSASVRGKIENGTLAHRGRARISMGALTGRMCSQRGFRGGDSLRGKEIHALLSELHDEPRPQRSLDELEAVQGSKIHINSK